MSDYSRRILELAEETGAVLYGDFTLSSGLKSDHYWDGKKITLSAPGTYLIGQAILERLAGLEIDAVGGPEIGAIPIATAVALVSHLEGRGIPSFIVRKSPKEHGTRKPVEGYLHKGNRVAVVEDVVTTGESVLKAIAVIEECGGKVVKVIALVDRHEGGRDKLRLAGYNFESILDFQKMEGRVVLAVSQPNP
ncbi:MAG: orotate phosphoribosyltransferase [Dehalococcoidia bacterium]|nr:orotate phosphoribosyltransferase [Dehalococcoidia bacterium]